MTGERYIDVFRNGNIVGHIPRELSRIFCFFILKTSIRQLTNSRTTVKHALTLQSAPNCAMCLLYRVYGNARERRLEATQRVYETRRRLLETVDIRQIRTTEKCCILQVTP